MKKQELERLFRSKSTVSNIEKAKTMISHKQIISLKGIKTEGYYSIYGKFVGDESVFIKIDMKKKDLQAFTCTCQKFKDYHKAGYVVFCEHLCAAAFGYIKSSNIKSEKEALSKLESRTGENIANAFTKNLDKLKKTDNKELGNNGLMESVIDAAKANNETTNLSESENCTGKNRTSESYFIDYVKESLKEGGRKKGQSTDSEFLKRQNINGLQSGGAAKGLREIVNSKDIGKYIDESAEKNWPIKIKLIHDKLSFNSEIVKRDMPLCFTLKEASKEGVEEIILSTRHKVPIMLTKDGSVWLYNWKVYVPSKTQIKAYMSYLKHFTDSSDTYSSDTGSSDTYSSDTCSSNKGSSDKGSSDKGSLGSFSLTGLAGSNTDIRYKKSMKQLLRLTKKLCLVTNEKYITISEGLKNYMYENFQIELYIYNGFSEDSRLNGGLDGERLKRDSAASYDICGKISLKYSVDKDNYNLDILRSKELGLLRDEKKEERILMIAERYKFFVNKETNVLLFRGDKDELINFVEDSRKFNISEDVNGEKLLISYEKQCIDMVFENVYREYSLGNNGKIKTCSDLSKGKKENEGFFRLMDFLKLKGVAVSEGKLFEQKQFLLEQSRDSTNNLNENSKFLSSVLEEKCKDIEYEENLNLFNASLRNYQVHGYKFLKALSILGLGGILADDMGLGKTIQVLSFLTREKSKTTLIVAPTSLIFNWISEIKRFAPQLSVGVIYGDRATRYSIMREDKDVYITSYGTLRRDIEDKYEESQCAKGCVGDKGSQSMYGNRIFDYCIIDEAQNIKNYRSAVSLAVKRVKAKVKFALSGTPMENNLMELWSLFDVRASDINEEMKIAAANAIADSISEEELNEDYIIPKAFNLEVQKRVAEAVKKAAIDSNIARI